MNVAHARELYQRIMLEHPDSEWARKATVRLEELEKLRLHNKQES